MLIRLIEINLQDYIYYIMYISDPFSFFLSLQEKKGQRKQEKDSYVDKILHTVLYHQFDSISCYCS